MIGLQPAEKKHKIWDPALQRRKQDSRVKDSEKPNLEIIKDYGAK